MVSKETNSKATTSTATAQKVMTLTVIAQKVITLTATAQKVMMHQQINNMQMKTRLKAKLENDQYYTKQLQKLHDKGISFDQLWSGKLCLAVNTSSYKLRKERLLHKKIKEEFIDKKQMKKWKESENVRKVYEDLYVLCNPNDLLSDIYIVLIIKSIFAFKKECTHANTIWIQSVLEIIFDERHLSTKIDSEVVESWTENLTDMKAVNTYVFTSIFETN
ncbi:20270_t:CDS:2 [Funneliformis geosporum]|uniref:9587_t:CDS:1 n=1 Tax=Funneliformis geosporum TaxID=1117311 RepID=A0A9W4SJF2_9GLOM|nr:9587_t:CDS:2 [Funneliformis geosporum]CAI2185484.1 20270_t:CDS:2 [Funneliformis geosporum]